MKLFVCIMLIWFLYLFLGVFSMFLLSESNQITFEGGGALALLMSIVLWPIILVMWLVGKIFRR